MKAVFRIDSTTECLFKILNCISTYLGDSFLNRFHVCHQEIEFASGLIGYYKNLILRDGDWFIIDDGKRKSIPYELKIVSQSAVLDVIKKKYPDEISEIISKLAEEKPCQ